MWEELACLCRSMCVRERAGAVVVGGSCVQRVWGWQMCHTVRAATCLAAANLLTVVLFVTFFLSFSSFCFPLSERLLTPLIYQFAIASNIPISRRRNSLNAHSNLKSQSIKTLERPLDVWIQSSVEKGEAVFTCRWQLKWAECLAATTWVHSITITS